jgi:hypothetical protein
MNDEQVLKAMIQEYGPSRCRATGGFGLVAWLMPILYLLGGTALVIVVMKRWRRPVAVAARSARAGARFAQLRRANSAARDGGELIAVPVAVFLKVVPRMEPCLALTWRLLRRHFFIFYIQPDA